MIHPSAGFAAALVLCLGAACSKGPAAATAASSQVTGAPGQTVERHEVRGVVPRAKSGVAIVTLTPEIPHDLPPPAEQAQMDQVNETFVPQLLLVRTGQPVLFLNDDDTLHNVRVREEATKEGMFNVAIPTSGRYTFTFPRDGFYIVGCDIHPAMAGAIFAASTPYVTLPAPDSGEFSIPDVDPGGYTATVYLAGQPVTRHVEVAGPVTSVSFDDPS
jgi:plastocyanin